MALNQRWGLGGVDECPGGANCIHKTDPEWVEAAGVPECLGGNLVEETEVVEP